MRWTRPTEGRGTRASVADRLPAQLGTLTALTAPAATIAVAGLGTLALALALGGKDPERMSMPPSRSIYLRQRRSLANPRFWT